MSELALRVPAPTVDLAKRGPRNGMAESTLNRIDAFTGLLEAPDDLRDVVRVDVAETKLAILVVLADCVHMALLANKETEVVAAGDASDANLVAEGHQDWVAYFLSLHRERPGECFT